jgi:hypothetical protein
LTYHALLVELGAAALVASITVLEKNKLL